MLPLLKLNLIEILQKNILILTIYIIQRIQINQNKNYDLHDYFY